MRKKLLPILVVALFLISNVLLAQEKTITGTITDGDDGMPLPGVTVVVKGTSQGTSADFDGNFTLDNVAPNAVLQFTMIGYTSQEISAAGKSVINISMSADAQQLDEVVVTSLGLTRDKKSLGYSVTELDGESVSLVKESNVASSLAGKVAGVVVTKSTSGVGGGTRVVIRGNNSITGNNQPLYVVDGVPIDNSSLETSNGAEYSVPDLGNGISDINPDDIESMSILKGPNAAALYGSRASNGVIIITTKSGRKTKGLGVTYTTSATFDTPLVLPEYQNEYGRGNNGNFPQIDTTADLATQVNSVTSNGGSWGPKFDGTQHLEFNGKMRPYVAQPNNVKDFFETGSSYINTLALNAGSEKATVRFSYTNSDLESILPNSNVKRNNFNLRGTANLSDRLSLDAKITYFIQDARNRPTQGTEGVVAYVYPLARNVAIDDLKHYQDLENPIDPNNPYKVIAPTASGGNPYWMLENDYNGDKRTRITGFAKLEYKFTDWLSAFARVGTDAIQQDTEAYEATGHHFFPDGRIRFTKNDRTETNYDFLFMFNKDVGANFNISANAGGNMRHSTYSASTINGYDFKIPGKYFLDNTDGTQLTATQTDLIEKRVNSIYGSTSFSYNDMVYLDLTARNDWSSALAADNRSYFYSSASLSVLLNEMFNFGESINLLKLKGSTANVGNDTDAQQIVNVFTVASNGYLGNTQINRPNIRFSESLQPEDIRSNEFGLEFKAFRNRLYADFSYYDISSKNLIFDVPVDPGTGYDFFRENVGEITNKGFEFLIGGTPIQNENFAWDVSLNMAKNENKLAKLIDGQENFTFSSSNGGIVDVRAQVGGGYGDIYATDWLRTDDGQLILTAEGLPQATSERVKVGNYQPDFSGGFTNTFRIKDFTLNTLIDFRVGGEVFSYTDAGLDASGVSERSLKYRDGGVVVDGVVDDGSGNYSANTELISAQEYWGAVSGIGSEYVFSQTNIRLRELSLTYNLPAKFLDRTFLTGLSLSAVGRNLFFIYKEADNFDPESSYSTSNLGQGVLFYALPTTRSIGLSMNVKF
ncbi:SusC/RagA family TonB-linked outer membrane protein [Joostella sp. CR20]|uniref:SusC/RagA family TonB-linked outer membrane protein n=1 Tax=Joostella sp. CR20 TaxID=2804312 RepID=UPI00313AF1CF